MYYSIKMRNYVLISWAVSLVILGIVMFGHPWLEKELAIGIMGISYLIAFLLPFVLGRSIENFIEKSKEFRRKMQFCYSCGFDLKDAGAADVCPQCKAQLNLREIIDVKDVKK